MSDERFEHLLGEAARDYRAPPPTPRDEMWEAVQALRAQRTHRRLPRSLPGGTWVRWGVGLAAALAIGVGIGRMTPGAGTAPPGTPPSRPAASVSDAAALEGFQWAAAAHLEEVESFLTMFRVDTRTGVSVAATEGVATDLLGTTRLLLDSPAATDEALAQLLNDIELVLMQISLYAGSEEAGELEFIDQSMDQRAVLLRLRAVVPGETEPAALRGVL